MTPVWRNRHRSPQLLATILLFQTSSFSILCLLQFILLTSVKAYTPITCYYCYSEGSTSGPYFNACLDVTPSTPLDTSIPSTTFIYNCTTSAPFPYCTSTWLNLTLRNPDPKNRLKNVLHRLLPQRDCLFPLSKTLGDCYLQVYGACDNFDLLQLEDLQRINEDLNTCTGFSNFNPIPSLFPSPPPDPNDQSWRCYLPPPPVCVCDQADFCNDQDLNQFRQFWERINAEFESYSASNLNCSSSRGVVEATQKKENDDLEEEVKDKVPIITSNYNETYGVVPTLAEKGGGGSRNFAPVIPSLILLHIFYLV